jgi:hypothetical protein
MQSTSFYRAPKFTAAPIRSTPEVAADYMRASDNLRQLRNMDRVAYDAAVARMDTGGETWQAVDVDVCHELARRDDLSEQAEVSAMRRGE